VKNCRYLELPYPDGASFGILQPLEIDAQGQVSAPDKSGLGVELDWQAIDANTVAII
jgi:L-alanine-DL-glutamate epimerase-like enolase superfamily enzyme